MRRSSRAGAVFALAAMVLAPGLAGAQGTSNTTYNFAAGWAVPTGDFGDFNQSGFALIGGLGLALPGSPVRFRAEALYNQFDHKNPNDGTSRAGGFTANALYDFNTGPGSQFTPYAIGGIGLYGARIFDDFDTQWNAGWNIGGGVKFPLSGFSVYVEARYHSANDVNFAPIVFGIVF